MTISSNNYKAMPIILNSITQSDYGVGDTPVTFTFNCSVHYIVKNMKLQVTIPSEMEVPNLTFDLNFYGKNQNDVKMVQVQSSLLF